MSDSAKRMITIIFILACLMLAGGLVLHLTAWIIRIAGLAVIVGLVLFVFSRRR